MKKETNNPTKCPICGRLTHKKSKYCIFHASAEEKNEVDFEQALKRYVNKVKEEGGDFEFKEFIFIGSINFKEDLNITIINNAKFREATFQGYPDFRGGNLQGRCCL